MRQPKERSYGFIGGAALGAAIMYWLDPQKGRRRRAGFADKLNHAARELEDAALTGGRDLVHRGRGLYVETASRLRHASVSDEVVAARVHSKLGHVCSHPGAVAVSVRGGRVWLSGKLLRAELEPLLRSVGRVRGVEIVQHDFEVHDDAGMVPELQGGVPRHGARFELMQEHWSPGARLLAGASGAALVGYGLERRSAVGAALGVAGALLGARSISNRDVGSLLGIGASRRGFSLTKSLTIGAPIEDVFAFVAAPENFPRLMRYVREVRRLEGQRFHWVFDGPVGVPVTSETLVTESVPNERIAFVSAEGAQVGLAGLMRFERAGDGATRLHVRLDYVPPAGALGRAFATAVGKNPKKQLDEDMLRLKSLFEHGKASARGHTVTRDELQS